MAVGRLPLSEMRPAIACSCATFVHQTADQDERVRRFRGTGDVFITKEYPRPWISEMYGYVFGTAVAPVATRVPSTLAQLDRLRCSPDAWRVDHDPFLVHYGILVEIDDWKWDKHDELNGRGVGAQDKLRQRPPLVDPFALGAHDDAEHPVADRPSGHGRADDAGRRSPAARARQLHRRCALGRGHGVAASRFPRPTTTSSPAAIAIDVLTPDERVELGGRGSRGPQAWLVASTPRSRPRSCD